MSSLLLLVTEAAPRATESNCRVWGTIIISGLMLTFLHMVSIWTQPHRGSLQNFLTLLCLPVLWRETFPFFVLIYSEWFITHSHSVFLISSREWFKKIATVSLNCCYYFHEVENTTLFILQYLHNVNVSKQQSSKCTLDIPGCWFDFYFTIACLPSAVTKREKPKRKVHNDFQYTFLCWT